MCEIKKHWFGILATHTLIYFMPSVPFHIIVLGFWKSVQTERFIILLCKWFISWAHNDKGESKITCVKKEGETDKSFRKMD
jgi:hypothetical protein